MQKAHFVICKSVSHIENLIRGVCGGVLGGRQEGSEGGMG